MFIANEDSAAAHILRIESLGYTVVEDSTLQAGRPPMRSTRLTRANLQIRPF